MKRNLSIVIALLISVGVLSSMLVVAAPPCGTPKTGPCPTDTPTTPNPTVEPTVEPTTEPTPEPTTTPDPTDGNWELVWADEFNGSDINLNNWTYDLGGDGWGNNELQDYRDTPENARIENGMLIIEARNERYKGRSYTSARLKTQGLQSWTYGRVEARIRVPYGNGIWPAFWMLGENITEVGWPYSGEIDIMEHIGREPYTVYGTVHGPNYSGGESVGDFITLNEPVTNSFHDFAVEWTPNQIIWYMDGVEYHRVTPADVPGDWVFNDHDFFIILNVAVGGYWPGEPDATTVFPQRMYVDYVRVYQ